ncbi:MAG: methyltransferase domain-containing protein [Candidatus Omnitrophica bacterium]|nr:methyltransferase domain-containing protein [Candidatus Omnitrophota bacterium]MDD5352449.1 methyltransferase domain-containing protein [Candidatus Omnitrophota bacterium]MDD5550047.1 methyltransferase domain-containing protein [Candidatus Omnitrophota bacterium]
MKFFEKQLHNLEEFVANNLPTLYKLLKKAKVLYQKSKYYILKARSNHKDIIYDDKFFNKNLEWNVPIAAKLTGVLIDYFNPSSVVDLGCGNAEFLSEFQKRGIPIQGYEGSRSAIEKALVDKKYIQLFDLRNKIELDKRYDLALCLEVAEHIENKFSQRLVENLTNLSDTIIFTAATPGQGGHFHINEQPHEFWVNIFKERNYDYDDKITERVKAAMREKKILWWYCDNLMIFRKAI